MDVCVFRCIQPYPDLPLLPPIQPIHASKCLTRHLQQPPLVKQLLIAGLVYIAVCDVVQKQRTFEMSVEPHKRKETTSSQTKKVDFEDHSLGFRPQITGHHLVWRVHELSLPLQVKVNFYGTWAKAFVVESNS